MVLTRHARSFGEWREAARPLLTEGVRPEDVEWRDEPAPLAGAAEVPMPATAANQREQGPQLRLSRHLMSLLECIAHYRHPGRWELMYRLAYRTLNENPRLLEDEADHDVRHATLMERAVNRECHKMHAFVRFRETRDEHGETTWFAWFEPEHEILRRGTPFFTKRFPNMKWTIATPDGAAVWEGHELEFIDAPDLANRPREDAHEGLWRTYYRSICNVARINPNVMQREMPQRYWKHLPEAAEIGTLVRDGRERFAQRHQESDETALRMAKAVQRSLSDISAPSEGPAACRRCGIWQHATQAVIGEGPTRAAIMLVGEQPGDEEDLRGRAFVGPAGRLLDDALGEAGLERGDLFITNAVKHFKWEPRGKRRLHKRPDVAEIKACNVWLEREIDSVQPSVIVALGATALRALTGRSLSIEQAREQPQRMPNGAQLFGTYHPAAILRAEGDRATQLRAALIEDLRRARAMVREGHASETN